MLFFWLACVFGVLGDSALAYDPKQIILQPETTPRELENIGVDEKLGQSIPVDAALIHDDGTPVTVGQFLSAGKPLVLAVVYYECPTLCNLHLNGLTDALKQIDWVPGRDYHLVAVSMDPREGPAVAGAKKANYVKAFARVGAKEGWHFLTGTEAQIRRVADSIGFKYRWDEATKQFAHASATVLITPKGVVSRYLHGVQPEPKTLRLALLEASEGRIGTIVDRIVMFCFQFDPRKSEYTIYAWRIMQIGVIITVLAALILLVPIWRREFMSVKPSA